MPECWSARLSSIWSVWYQNEKTNNAGSGPVPDQAKAVRPFFVLLPDWNYWRWNADAGVSFLDADAHLCQDLSTDTSLDPFFPDGALSDSDLCNRKAHKIWLFMSWSYLTQLWLMLILAMMRFPEMWLFTSWTCLTQHRLLQVLVMVRSIEMWFFISWT